MIIDGLLSGSPVAFEFRFKYFGNWISLGAYWMLPLGRVCYTSLPSCSIAGVSIGTLRGGHGYVHVSGETEGEGGGLLWCRLLGL